MILTKPKAFFSHKKHKEPMAIETLNAPIGARKISKGSLNAFCAFSWPT